MVRSVAYMAAVVLGVIRAKRMVTSSYRSMRKLMTIHKARVYAKSIVMLRDSDGFTTAIYYLDRYYPLEVTGSHCMPSSALLSKTTQSLWHLMGNGTCGPVLDSNHHKTCTYSSKSASNTSLTYWSTFSAGIWATFIFLLGDTAKILFSLYSI